MKGTQYVEYTFRFSGTVSITKKGRHTEENYNKALSVLPERIKEEMDVNWIGDWDYEEYEDCDEYNDEMKIKEANNDGL